MTNRFSGFAERLREATRPAHRALDHHPLLAPLTRSPLAVADYANALAALHGPHAAIERLLRGFAPAAEFPARLPDLEIDLEMLGCKPFPLAAVVPEFEEPAQRIGAMYVIEGANLGGALIARLMSESLAPTVSRAFFGNSGGAVRWARFQQFAKGSFQEASSGQIIEAAIATFTLFKAHLDDCLTPEASEPRPAGLSPWRVRSG